MPAALRHFAVTAADLDRARAFYEAVMGWRFAPWLQPDVLLLEGAGVSGLIHTPVTVSGRPLLGLEPTFSVDDLDATVARVEAEGGQVLQARAEVRGVGELIRVVDPAGTILVAMRYERPPAEPPRRPGAARLRHFAINADDVGRSKRFYERVFDWSFTPWGPPDFYQTRSAGPGQMGALQGRRSIAGVRMPDIELTFGVDDLEATQAAINATGGRVLMAPFHIETVGRLIFFQDPHSNIAGAMQYESIQWPE